MPVANQDFRSAKPLLAGSPQNLVKYISAAGLDIMTVAVPTRRLSTVQPASLRSQATKINLENSPVMGRLQLLRSLPTTNSGPG